MTLGQKQERFARLLPRLLDHAHELGYDVRMGEALRMPEQAEWNATHCGTCRRSRDLHGPGHAFHAIGIRASLHCQKLAVDLILCRDGKPLWDAESYRALGEWWEEQDEMARHGRHFRDPCHFSLEHEGRREIGVDEEDGASRYCGD